MKGDRQTYFKISVGDTHTSSHALVARPSYLSVYCLGEKHRWGEKDWVRGTLPSRTNMKQPLLG